MDNTIITKINENTVRIEAASGYKLYSTLLNREISVAEINKNLISQFKVIEK